MLPATRFPLAAAFVPAVCAAGPADARPTRSAGAREPVRPYRAAARDSARRIDVNQINMFAWNSGQFAWDPQSFAGGLYFPKGTDHSVVFNSGLWLGGKVGGAVRVALAEYASEFGPGPMVGGAAVDPALPQHRVYKVVRWTGNPADSAHVVRSASELVADPHLDPLAHHGWGEYVAVWSDPDIGGFGDDVAGCDTTRDLGIAYNAKGIDPVYDTRPPAVGYMILRGPVGLAAGDTLGLSSFNQYVGGNDPAAAAESYRLMRGLLRNGDPIVDPTTGQPTRYFHLGDPVRGTGSLDENSSNQLMMVSSGPFRMAPGDTQQVLAALMVGRGADRLASVGV